MLLAALEATLQLYRDGRHTELPALKAMHAPLEELRQRATRLALDLQQRGVSCAVVETVGRPGGGSLPLRELPGYGVRLSGDGPRVTAALREESVIALVRDGAAVLDVRCVSDLTGLALATQRAVQASVARAGEVESATLEAGEAEV
jgi:L-seryl-tRNA(Ser) seleniumtransferase